MESVHIALVFSVSILSLVFAVRVLLADKKNIVNKAFSVFAFSIATWIVCDFSLYQKSLENYQTLLNKINLVNICAMVFFLSYFVSVFPRQIFRIPKIVQIIAVASTLFLSVTILVSNKIVQYAFMEDYGSNFKQGSLFYLFAIFATIFALYSVIILILKYLKFSGEERVQIKFVFWGISMLTVLNLIFNLFVPLITKSFMLGRLGTYSAIFLVAFTAYAILKAHLFNLKVILTETAIVIINIVLAIQVFSSETVSDGILKTIFLGVVIYGSYILLKSVRHEIQQREEIQKLAKKLDDANKHLEDLDEQKDNFISMASHELNTPIAAIEGYLSMIIDEKMAGEINEKAMKYLKNIYGSSKRLASLVKDLLNVSRIESNRIHIIYTEAQIEDIIDQAVAEIMIKIKEVGHTLEWVRPKQALPKTYLDVPRIIEVMINLLGNAIKYTDPPGKIKILAQADNEKIVVSVSDNGRGIPKEKYGHIFEKFSQVNVLKDQVKGTGLGMFISKNLVEMHKGKLWFTSSVEPDNHGTTFYFSLPILKTKPVDPHEGEGALFAVGKPKAAATVAMPSQITTPVDNKTP